MYERGISYQEVKKVIEEGEIIESYPEDKPYPTYLILGFPKGKPVHVVFAVDRKSNMGIVITVYRPNPLLWEEDFRRRKKT